MALDLSSRRVLLTGATGGIGRAIAHALSDRGATLALTARNPEALGALRTELGTDRATAHPADLADRAQLAALTEAVGEIDVLVANAALPAAGRLETFTSEDLDRALEVNLRAPMQLTRSLLDGMVERGYGHLVFVNSAAGKVALTGSSIYSAGKFGLRGFALSLHDELRGTGVGVTSVFPSFIRDAGMFAKAGVELPRGFSTRAPREVADAVLAGIERGTPEIDVAPLSVRAGGWIAGATPSLVATLSRRFGSERVADSLEQAQRDQR
ncbi:MAG: SDR family NAD(P)-dependent oxidoreductase [Thermoleophilaceae bacterium]